MAETVEMSSVTVNKGVNNGGWCGPWFANRSNAFVALIFAIVGIAAAVGLGSGDWYAVEASTSTPVSVATLDGTFVTTFNTQYYGLRLGYTCYGPQSTIPYGTTQENSGFGASPCFPYTYRSMYLAANYQNNNLPSGPAQDAASDSSVAYFHLIGASGVITALLAVAIVIAGHQFLINILHAHGVQFPQRISGRISLVILIILEALVIIFWVTIFPYSHFYNYESTLLPGASSYDTYHTIGLGLAIQFAGLLVGLFGLFHFPSADAVFKNQV